MYEQRYYSDATVFAWVFWAIAGLLAIAACIAWFGFGNMGWTMILALFEGLATGAAIVVHVRGYAQRISGMIRALHGLEGGTTAQPLQSVR